MLANISILSSRFDGAKTIQKHKNNMGNIYIYRIDNRCCHLVGAETARIGWLIRLTTDMFVFLPLQTRNLGRRMMKNGRLAERSIFEGRAGMKMAMHLQPENHQKTLETASDPCSRPFQTQPKIPFPKKTGRKFCPWLDQSSRSHR